MKSLPLILFQEHYVAPKSKLTKDVQMVGATCQ